MSKKRTHCLVALCALCFLSTTALAQGGLGVGDAIHVDFGSSGNSTPGNWNNMTSASGTLENVVTEMGVVTGIGFAIPDRFNGVNENGTTAPDAALGLPMEATRNSFYGNDVVWGGLIEPTAQVVISGLDPSSSYELTFFASRMGVGDNRQTQYTLSGSTERQETLFLDPANNVDKNVISRPVQPSALGQIIIDCQKGPENNNSYGFYYLGVLTLRVSQNLGATRPSPESEAIDVLRDAILGWAPGQFAVTHNVYFGTVREDLEAASIADPRGVLVSAAQDANSYDPGRLEFDQVYYWRVDEVNGTPDKTVHRGAVWRFTAEPYAIEIPGSTISISASSSAIGNNPIHLIDGSGLTGTTHSTENGTEWLSAVGDMQPFVLFDLSKAQALDKMLIWNSNTAMESFVGMGAKDVVLETSLDGETWTVVEGVTSLTKAPGLDTYNTPEHIALDGVVATQVRLQISSNWGGLPVGMGLSEVKFYAIPTVSRTPVPASGSVDIRPDTLVTWRAGRDAGQHTVYVSTDLNAVVDGVAPSGVSSQNRLDLSSFGLQLGQTYYWRVDEVNEAEAMSVWAGPVWSFTTSAALTVDDFESYTNISPDRPFQTWLDGFGYSADEFFPVAFGGNGTGAGIGHDIWSPGSPYFDGQIMETVSTVSGSSQSLPFYYSNTGALASQTERTFAVPQDWTMGGAKTLSIAFRGQVGNTGTLYAKINNTRILYSRDPANIAIEAWQAWNIDLSTVNTNLQSVTNLTIGVEGNGAAGMVLIDDIRLYAQAGELLIPEDPGTTGLVAYYTFEGNASDVSGHGHDGTVNGDAQFVTGHDGSALDFDGVDNYVSTGKSASDLGMGGNSPRTVSAWVLTRGFANGAIFDVGNRANGEDFSLRTLDSIDNRWRIQYWGGDYDFSFDTVDKWVHFTHVHDGVSTQIYANGLLIVDWAKTINTMDTNPFQIGLYGWPGNYFDGLIDDVRIYNRALSAGEALWLAGVTTPIDKPF